MRISRHLSLAFFLIGAALVHAGGVGVGDRFPALGGFALDGALPGPLAGRVVLVDFWASWCAPCKASFPALGELQKNYAGRGLVILGVSVDEHRADFDAFVRRQKPVFAVLQDRGQQLVSAVQVAAMPTSFLIDRHGTVRFVHEGFHGDATRRQLRDEIEKLLAEP